MTIHFCRWIQFVNRIHLHVLTTVVNTTSITLSANKIQTRNILVPANSGPRGKWPLKRRERIQFLNHENCFQSIVPCSLSDNLMSYTVSGIWRSKVTVNAVTEYEYHRVFRTVRPTNFKLGIWMEYNDPHHRHARWPRRSKVKIITSRLQFEMCLPITRQRKSCTRTEMGRNVVRTTSDIAHQFQSQKVRGQGQLRDKCPDQLSAMS